MFGLSVHNARFGSEGVIVKGIKLGMTVTKFQRAELSKIGSSKTVLSFVMVQSSISIEILVWSSVSGVSGVGIGLFLLLLWDACVDAFLVMLISSRGLPFWAKLS